MVKKIADINDRMDEPVSALSYYEWASTLNPTDVALQARVDSVRNKVAEMQIQAMEAEIESNPDAPDIEDKRALILDI